MMWFLDKIMHRAVCYKGAKQERIITEDMRAAADVAVQQWNDYQTRFVPFENKFIADVTKDPMASEEAISGAANADVMQKLASNPSATNPNAAISPAKEASLGKALSTVGVDSRDAALDNKAEAMSTVVNMGRGERVEALNSQMGLAESSGNTALTNYKTDLEHSTNERGAIMQTAGRALGVAGAVGANYNWGGAVNNGTGPTIANANFNDGTTGRTALNNTVVNPYTTGVNWE